MSVVPAIIPNAPEEAERLLAPLGGLPPAVQIDIVDGVFVPFRSWPYGIHDRQPLAPLSAIARSYELEFDLMVENPETLIRECVEVGARRVIIHVESTAHVGDCIAIAREGGVLVGLALNNDTMLEAIEPFASDIDFIQCMGIARIGTQGQPFDERVLARIRAARAIYPDIPVSVDGGVSERTIGLLKHAGATRCVAGSAIFGAPDPRAAYLTLTNLFNTSS